MKRRWDWSDNLATFVENRRRTPFAWGSNDCALFAADAVFAQTGRDLAQDLRTYSDQAGAERVIQDAGFQDLFGLASSLLSSADAPRVGEKHLQRGDVAMVLVEDGDGNPQQSLSILNMAGDALLLPGPVGMVRYPRGRALACWRLEPDPTFQRSDTPDDGGPQ